MKYTLKRLLTNNKAARFHYKVFNEKGELLTERKSNREYIACTIDGRYFFGRIDLIGKGAHGYNVKIRSEVNINQCPIAYLEI